MAGLPIEEMVELGSHWHTAGSISDEVLHAIHRLAPANMQHSAETGCGRSTILLSHLSANHTAFTLGDTEGYRDDSARKTRNSPLLQAEKVTFVYGPTQLTVPKYEFTNELDLAMIDGPHGFPFPMLEYYYFYPHVRKGGMLIVDDIHIPSITPFFDFLVADQMWDLTEVVGTTAFYTRTNAETFNPLGDGWWLQGYNEEMYKEMQEEEANLAEQPAPATTSWIRSHAPEWIKKIYRTIRY